MTAQVILQKGREKSLLRRHPWIFTSAIHKQHGKLRSGDTVDVLSADGRWLARGAFSPASAIRVRVWTFDQTEVVDNAFFLRRIEAAVAARVHLKSVTNAYRLVASESDGLPGITIDCYDNILVCQLLSAGADKHRDKLVWALNKCFPDHAILERSDVSIRSKEGLEPLVQVLHGKVPDEIEITEHGHRFIVDLKNGHKTGFYLDQRKSRLEVAAWARDKTVLNCFSYTGAMGVYCLAAGAAHVTNMDVSAPALALATRNAELNQLPIANLDNTEADVFAALRGYRAEGRHFDMIILDPPKFVENKQHLPQACRGYKDINMLAMQLLNPGGILATFSCSGLLPEDLFHKVVADAALDAGRTVQYLQKLSQDSDHLVSSAYPEGYYLKGLLCRAN